MKNNIDKYFDGIDTVFLVANADVRYGLSNRKKDIEQNILVTQKILKVWLKKIKKLIFSSTGSV